MFNTCVVGKITFYLALEFRNNWRLLKQKPRPQHSCAFLHLVVTHRPDWKFIDVQEVSWKEKHTPLTISLSNGIRGVVGGVNVTVGGTVGFAGGSGLSSGTFGGAGVTGNNSGGSVWRISFISNLKKNDKLTWKGWIGFAFKRCCFSWWCWCCKSASGDWPRIWNCLAICACDASQLGRS